MTGTTTVLNVSALVAFDFLTSGLLLRDVGDLLESLLADVESLLAVPSESVSNCS